MEGLSTTFIVTKDWRAREKLLHNDRTLIKSKHKLSKAQLFKWSYWSKEGCSTVVWIRRLVQRLEVRYLLRFRYLCSILVLTQINDIHDWENFYCFNAFSVQLYSQSSDNMRFYFLCASSLIYCFLLSFRAFYFWTYPGTWRGMRTLKALTCSLERFQETWDSNSRTRIIDYDDTWGGSL